MKRRLGQQETQMLAYLQMRGQRVVCAGEISRALRLSRVQERRLLARLAHARVVARVRRGLYLVPATLPLGGSWTPDEILALNTLMADSGGRYQICGPNAFNRYGFSEQIPTRLYAYNDRISGERCIGAATLVLIKVASGRLGATERVRTPAGDVAVYSSRARTLVDAVYDWSRFNSLPRAFSWIRSDLEAGRVSAAALVRITLRFGDVGTIRRIGALLDRAGAPSAAVRRLGRALKPSTALIPWIPTRPKRGEVDRRWGVVWNEQA
jgi:predicted transcriptional regulator of viral defense system